MLFNSLQFFVFLAVVFTLYWRLSHRAQNRFLLFASYVFYSAWSWKFSFLMLGSTVVDYFCGIKIQDAPQEKKTFWRNLSIAFNLTVLGFFKYFDFFVIELAQLLTWMGWGGIDWRLSIVLPVGISFYTFQTMSYSWDVYRGEVKPVRNFWDFALFVSFFPQLVAGPIERAKQLLPQILSKRDWSRERFYEGSYLIFFGLFKKVYVADTLAPYVNEIFSTPVQDLVWIDVACGSVLFAFQIYGDFSGYTDIARGVAKWLGFELMLNFKLPYFSTSPSAFWRQWHISLSSWLRDYLYIPLGGNRGSCWLTYRNLMLTMLLGGLWHGANWTFIIWGAFHGVLLCTHRVWSKSMGQFEWFSHISQRYTYRLVAGTILFACVCLSWLIFRAESFTQLSEMVRVLVMFEGDFSNKIVDSRYFTSIYLLLGIQLYQYWKGDLLAVYRQHWVVKGIVYLILFTKLLEGTGHHAEAFIYFQF